MRGSLARSLGLEKRELVAFTGAGGKSTLMLRLADELAAAQASVLVTTTTKMGRDQIISIPVVCERDDAEAVTEVMASGRVVALATGGDNHKATGPPPEVVDDLYVQTPVDYLLVEADGAQGRSLKAPGEHEPVIPSETTTVVVLMGVDAVGGRIADVAHRPEEAAALTGLTVGDRIDVEQCVAVLTHPEGGLKGVPPSARVVVALTKIATPAREATARQIAGRLEGHERISRVMVLG